VEKIYEKLMKRLDQSWKEIKFEGSYRKELEKLWELQIHGKLSNQWLQERFGESRESSGGSKQEEGKSKEITRIGATPKEEDSNRIPEEVVGELDHVTPEDDESHHEIDTILHTHVNP
jgi:hypothetical protein